MLPLFQLLFTVFTLYAIAGVFMRKKERLLGPRGAIFWSLFWLSALVLVWSPDTTTAIARLFGIGRGTDFIVYIALAAVFLLLFRLHIKIETVGRDITSLTRIIALEKDKRNPPQV